MGWCGARAPGSRRRAEDTLSDCLSLSSLGAQPSPAPKSVPLGDESGESPLLNALPRLQEMKEGESRAFWAWRVGCGVCSHAPPLVSKEEPYGGSSGRWAGPRLGVM